MSNAIGRPKMNLLQIAIEVAGGAWFDGVAKVTVMEFVMMHFANRYAIGQIVAAASVRGKVMQVVRNKSFGAAADNACFVTRLNIAAPIAGFLYFAAADVIAASLLGKVGIVHAVVAASVAFALISYLFHVYTATGKLCAAANGALDRLSINSGFFAARATGTKHGQVPTVNYGDWLGKADDGQSANGHAEVFTIGTLALATRLTEAVPGYVKAGVKCFPFFSALWTYGCNYFIGLRRKLINPDGDSLMHFRRRIDDGFVVANVAGTNSRFNNIFFNQDGAN